MLSNLLTTYLRTGIKENQKHSVSTAKSIKYFNTFITNLGSIQWA